VTSQPDTAPTQARAGVATKHGWAPLGVSRLWGIVTAVVILAIYILLLVLYSVSGQTKALNPGARPPTGGVVVDITLRAMQAATDRLDADVSLIPDQSLINTQRLSLTKSLIVEIAPTAGAQQLVFRKNETPGTFPVSFLADGALESWPFDKYNADVLVNVITDQPALDTPVPYVVSINGKLQGWAAQAVDQPNSISVGDGSLDSYRTTVYRSGGQLAFAVIMVLVLIAMPVIAIFALVQIAKGKRKAEPTLAGFFAAMLFATVPLRNFLPGSPPPGSAIDAAVVLWVIVALVGCLAVFVWAWVHQGELLEAGARARAESEPEPAALEQSESAPTTLD